MGSINVGIRTVDADLWRRLLVEASYHELGAGPMLNQVIREWLQLHSTTCGLRAFLDAPEMDPEEPPL
jgi:hypothetical protein